MAPNGYETDTLNSSAHTFHLNYLSVISVTGADSASFLQGQISCNIKNLTPNQASIAAYCTAKGRVISIMIVVPHVDGFWLILPSSLVELVQKRLQMFVLRSAVQLRRLEMSVIGITSHSPNVPELSLPLTNFACISKDSLCLVKIPSVHEARYLFLTPDLPKLDLGSTELWRLEDISAGLPWFEVDQTESYTPHMLNLDTLGGISLDKGCYTGQEIVARTHYLGKNKRQLYAGQINADIIITPGQSVVDPKSLQTLGHVLYAQSFQQITRLLMVLNLETDHSGEYAIDDTGLQAIELLQ